MAKKPDTSGWEHPSPHPLFGPRTNPFGDEVLSSEAASELHSEEAKLTKIAGDWLAESLQVLDFTLIANEPHDGTRPHITSVRDKHEERFRWSTFQREWGKWCWLPT